MKYLVDAIAKLSFDTTYRYIEINHLLELKVYKFGHDTTYRHIEIDHLLVLKVYEGVSIYPLVLGETNIK